MQLDTEELTRGDPELKRLHQQLETLHRSLSEFKDIHYYNNPGWPYILDQYNALLKRYENILEELHTSPLLKQMLVQPKTLENVDRIRLTDMIRTKVPLDMEEAEKSLQEKAYNLHGNKSLNLLDQGAMLRGLADQKALLKAYDARVYDALAVADPLRTQFEATLKPNRAERAKKLEEEAAEEENNDKMLVRGLMWMSNGPESWEEEEKRQKALRSKGGGLSYSV